LVAALPHYAFGSTECNFGLKILMQLCTIFGHEDEKHVITLNAGITFCLYNIKIGGKAD
jgi:hypothetical protein